MSPATGAALRSSSSGGRAHAETALDAIFSGDVSATADAIASGVALRTAGLLARWQQRLRHYPDELAIAQIEEAALTEPDPHRALLVLTDLQAEAVALAPDGPNVDRARWWLGDARKILMQQTRRQ